MLLSRIPFLIVKLSFVTLLASGIVHGQRTVPQAVAPGSAARPLDPAGVPEPPKVSPSAAEVPKLVTERPNQRYLIGPGDVLQINIYDQPQLSREAVRIDGSGSFRMPFVANEINALCKSESELARDIADQYQEYLKNPEVSVYIREYSSQPVAVIGAVLKPGSFQLGRPVRLRELLTYAGGLGSQAGRIVHMVHDQNMPSCWHQGPQPPSDVETYSLEEVMSGSVDANPFVRAGDVVNVPEAEQIFVVGNVPRPSSIPLRDDTMTISRAIAMAGGAMPNSKSHVRVLRQSPGQPGNQEILVKLSDLRVPGNADIKLQPGDIVDVQLAQGKLIFKSIFTSFASGALLYYPIYAIR